MGHCRTRHVPLAWQPCVIVSMGICLHVLVAKDRQRWFVRLNWVQCKLIKTTTTYLYTRDQRQWISGVLRWVILVRGWILNSHEDATKFWNCPNLWSNGFFGDNDLYLFTQGSQECSFERWVNQYLQIGILLRAQHT